MTEEKGMEHVSIHFNETASVTEFTVAYRYFLTVTGFLVWEQAVCNETNEKLPFGRTQQS